ncbi:MAG: hypothetical protein AB3N11_03505 [Arenibacterium sp.]
MRIVRITAVAAMVTLPGLAQAVGFGVGIGVNPAFRTTVTPLQNGIYEVATHGTSAPIAYWCGIGDYVKRTLGASGNQRIYISRAYEKQVRTVQFSLTPPEGADTSSSYSVTVKRVGANMTANTAQNYCYDNFMDFGF